MSLLEYARQHALTSNAHLEDFDDIEFYVPPHGELEHGLQEPEGARLFCPEAVIDPERLTLDAESRTLLASVLRPPQHDGFHQIDTSATHAKRLKLEEPLLLTDAHVDVLSCKRNQPPTSFGKVSFDLIEVDEEADEGLAWPQAWLCLPDQYEKAAANERLVVTRDDALWLRAQLAVDDRNMEIDDTEGDQLKRRRTLKLMTPPLSPTPRSSDDDLSLSSPLAARLPPLSEGTSPAVHLRKAVNEQLMQADAVTSDNCGSLAHTGVLAALLNPTKPDRTPWSSSPFRFRAAKHKLDEPLTSPIRPSRGVTFSDEPPELSTEHLQEDWANLPTASEADFDELFKETFANGARQVEHRLETEETSDVDISMRLPLPRVAELDSVPPWLRENSELQLEAQAKDTMLALTAMRLHKLSTSFERKLPWDPLPTVDVQEITTETIEYKSTTKGFIACLNVDAGVDHETLTWKQEGLRFLDEHESDEEELDCAACLWKEPPTSQQGLAAVQKRKLPTEEPHARPGSADHRFPMRLKSKAMGKEPSAAVAQKLDIFNGPHDADDTPSFFPKRPVPDIPDESMMRKRPNPAPPVHYPTAEASVPDLFSASNDLGYFIGLQTGQLPTPKKRKLDHTAEAGAGAATAALTAASIFTKHQPTVSATSTAVLAAPAQAATPEADLSEVPSGTAAYDLPLPNITLPHPLIISSTLLTAHRPLINELTTLDPNLNLIERDFAGLEKSGFASPQSKIHAHTRNVADAAPDLLISPSTAILITTLQKVKQKSLPRHGVGHGGDGQGLSPLQQRILAVSQTCERVVVLVMTPSHSSSDTSTLSAVNISAGTSGSEAALAMDERDITALTSLNIWTSSLAPPLHDLDIEILSVPEDPTQVARWILALLAAESGASQASSGGPRVESGGIQVRSEERQEEKAPHNLLQDETTWEIFLRRAGLNAFAAQVVLIGLKAHGELDDGMAWEGMDADTVSLSLRGGSVAEIALTRENGGGRREIYGLPAFVMMGQDERERRFQGMLGGRRVLDRVGKVLDGRFRRG